jgi:chromosome segregation ATPase
MRPTSVFTAAVAAAALSACASTPAPVGELATARATIDRAEQPAARFAPSHLLAAQQKLTRAQAAFEREDYDIARRLAQQAEADAQLALAIAESSQARESLTRVQSGIHTLQQELSRTQP